MYSNASHEINLCDSVMLWCANTVAIFHKNFELGDSVTFYNINIIAALHQNLNHGSPMFCFALYTCHNGKKLFSSAFNLFWVKRIY
jgi:hypothetical protein